MPASGSSIAHLQGGIRSRGVSFNRGAGEPRFQNHQNSETPRRSEERRQAVPLGRYGRAEEVAAAIAFLVSDEASYITGQSLRIDGGLTRAV